VDWNPEPGVILPWEGKTAEEKEEQVWGLRILRN